MGAEDGGHGARQDDARKAERIPPALNPSPSTPHHTLTGGIKFPISEGHGYLCFAAGTPVLTPDGVRPIEEIQVGDLVLSRDQFNIEGKVRARPVEKLHRGNAEIFELVIGGQVIRATAPHPFFVRGRGWTAAADLIPGDLLATDGEGWTALQSRRATGEIVPVFNFDVAHDHTYFVGGGPGIWVHNSYGDFIALDRPFHFFITDNTNSDILFMGRLLDPSQLTSESTPTVVPEPNAAVLLGLAMIVASGQRRRRRVRPRAKGTRAGIVPVHPWLKPNSSGYTPDR